eukprot:CAMPEP_0180291000 /NCGR_PEP_ID=MMETSP0988-20121125/15817_1 /TAXON_ID=697907 /ORGANISM="non described non described, Strain CCMP2293" /LENGTH=78 /DNA_ID=CAMNT_0022266653 /DNA_START=459 /DNA_END=692 /DNA_ORIENTATION=+
MAASGGAPPRSSAAYPELSSRQLPAHARRSPRRTSLLRLGQKPAAANARTTLRARARHTAHAHAATAAAPAAATAASP